MEALAQREQIRLRSARSLWSFARPPEEDVLVTDTSIRARVGAVGICVDGPNRGLPAVGDGGLVDASAGIAAPRCFGARENGRTGDLTFLHKAQARAVQDRRRYSPP